MNNIKDMVAAALNTTPNKDDVNDVRIMCVISPTTKAKLESLAETLGEGQIKMSSKLLTMAVEQAVAELEAALKARAEAAKK
jgi:hypothetical protein